MRSHLEILQPLGFRTGFFSDGEFAWGDSAYPVNRRTTPVHKEPSSFIPENRIFDKVVSHLRVRSEHCIGVLKGRFQCLRGLRVSIRTKEDHIAACRWMTVAMILHNLVIEFEGVEHSLPHLDRHMLADEVVDGGQEGILYV